jgi:hypothetical protein
MVSSKVLLLAGTAVVLIGAVGMFLIGGGGSTPMTEMFKRYSIVASSEGGTTLKIFFDHDSGVINGEVTSSAGSIVLDGANVGQLVDADGSWSVSDCANIVSKLPDLYSAASVGAEESIKAASVSVQVDDGFTVDGVSDELLSKPIINPQSFDPYVPMMLWSSERNLNVYYRRQKYIVEFSWPAEGVEELPTVTALKMALGGGEYETFTVSEFKHGAEAVGISYTSGVAEAWAAYDKSSCTASRRRTMSSEEYVKRQLASLDQEIVNEVGHMPSRELASSKADTLRIVNFAKSAYDKVRGDAVETTGGLPSGASVEHHHIAGNTRATQINWNGDICHIAIAGTNDLTDALQDLDLRERAFDGHKYWTAGAQAHKFPVTVHNGFYNHLQTLKGACDAGSSRCFRDMAASCPGGFHIYGHSLGAAVSTLVGLDYGTRSVNLVAPPKAFLPKNVFKEMKEGWTCVDWCWYGCCQWNTYAVFSEDYDSAYYSQPVTQLNTIGDPVVQVPPGYGHVKGEKLTCGINHPDGNYCGSCSSDGGLFNSERGWWDTITSIFDFDVSAHFGTSYQQAFNCY